ncbi:hypothetical protein ACE1CA_18835 [Aerosakkonemataceae cyanobacterium BLCC-F167]|uniref:Uncharacterized protein n=1 Tax=Floridaenema evergladense BLCC-F167 TaxID=3153639 RepID=A0ABV4WNE0_9CYAN
MLIQIEINGFDPKTANAASTKSAKVQVMNFALIALFSRLLNLALQIKFKEATIVAFSMK